jgi:hypothetical protein
MSEKILYEELLQINEFSCESINGKIISQKHSSTLHFSILTEIPHPSGVSNRIDLI